MKNNERAVVLGSGMAGLLAARALADHYDRVVVIERDRLPDVAENRRGVAQGRHAHALLGRGQQLLESRFPGFTDEVAADGAPTGDMLERTRLHFSGHRLRPGPCGLTVISASRALLEHHVRRRLRERDDIEIIDGCDAAGLVVDGGRVGGVRLMHRADNSADESLAADVVVDATGRSSRASVWLQALGVRPPDEDRVTVEVSYATRRYRMDPDALGGDVAIITAATPQHPRTGALALLEGGVGMLTLAGMCGDRPPLAAEGFDEFAGSLEFADIAEAIASAEPLDEPVPHRFPASTWRRYDRIRHHLEGYTPIGDAVCSLNPIYGQGMTIAALEADALDRHLGRHGSLRPRQFQREIARIIGPAWQMAAGADLRFADVVGHRTRSQRILGSYITRLHAAAALDADLSRAFVRVSGLVDAPPSLLGPRIVARVLADARRRSGPDPASGRFREGVDPYRRSQLAAGVSAQPEP